MPNLSLIRANFSLSKSLALPYQTFLGWTFKGRGVGSIRAITPWP
jgi:hypothetical protein